MKIKLFIILFLLSIGTLFSAQAQCPNFSWAHASAASEFNDIGNAISIDTINNYIYVTGMYSDPGTFGGQNYLTHGMQDAFIAKLDLQGNYIWVKNGGGVQDDEGVDVAVDHQGNVYACEIVQGFAIFETDTTKGGKNYLVKYDSAGQIQWLKDYAINISALTIDHHGNLIICGVFNGNKPFEGDSLYTKGLNDIFLTSDAS